MTGFLGVWAESGSAYSAAGSLSCHRDLSSSDALQMNGRRLDIRVS